MRGGLAFCVVGLASSSTFVAPPRAPLLARSPVAALRLSASESPFSAPTAEENAALVDAGPSPALQPRELITTVMHALHKSNMDTPRMQFGSEVALRFLAPTNPASRCNVTVFSEYLSQTWYQPLLQWAEFVWQGDLTLLGASEAFQQTGVRSTPDAPWASVRWILRRVPYLETSGQWMVEAVFVEEPDGAAVGDVGSLEVRRGSMELDGLDREYGDSGDELAAAAEAAVAAYSLKPADVVRTIMEAVRKLDEPYRNHGAEVAIRYCSPTNRAARLSPEGFSRYLDEPWYAILCEWDEIEFAEAEEEGDDGRSVVQDALVKRASDDSWTIVSWRLSRYSGRWLTDSLTITE